MKKNIDKQTPHVLLLIILVGFPQISETIFSPSLPAISSAFHISMSQVQLTMSIYFIAFAIGVLFFGRLSDYIGRRKALLLGVAFYFVGNMLCFFAKDLSFLLVARFIQAFGASVGSVITQTILREAFTGVKRHQLFAQISAALAFTPAIGPLIGGFTDYYLGFKMMFIVLIVMSVSIFVYAYLRLPETASQQQTIQPLTPIMKRMATNTRLWHYALLIGGINGILFSYYAEAPFIFTQYFTLTSAQFGFLGIIVALASITGALLSKRLVSRIMPEKIIVLGIIIMLVGSVLTLVTAMMPAIIQLWLTIGSLFIVLLGNGMALPNCLSLALNDFQDVVASAGAVFSLVYYLLVSLITYGMSVWHDGTLTAMPYYFLCIGIIMLIASIRILQRHTTQ